MIIRPFINADQRSLITILEKNVPKFFAPSEVGDYKVYLEQYREDYFVLLQEEMLIGGGGINYFPAQRKARLSWDLLDPDYQGQGGGTALVTHRLNLLKLHPEVKEIGVRTSQLVYPFYEKMGFQLEKVVPDFWANGYDLYQMNINLG